MSVNTILCGRRGSEYCVSVREYTAWETQADRGWSKKPEFIQRRLFERYIDPVTALDSNDQLRALKNGFYMMAINCLLIETLVSFWRGWETTEPFKNSQGRYVKGKSGKAFRFFFRVSPKFAAFRSTKFHKHIRCGILHQGETTGGWTISRRGPLFDGAKQINAAKFHRELKRAIINYVYMLKNPPPKSKWRFNFDKKMKAVLQNCEE